MELQARITNAAALARLQRLARVFSPESRTNLNKKAGMQLHALVIETFEREGATQGRPQWQDLKLGGRYERRLGKDGVRRRTGRFLDKRLTRDASGNYVKGSSLDSVYMILQDTGALRQSFNWLFDADNAGVGTITGKTHADIAARHEYGDPSRNLPARPMLPTPDVAVAVVYSVYQIAVEAALKR